MKIIEHPEPKVDVLILTAMKEECDAVVLNDHSKPVDGWTEMRDKNGFLYYRGLFEARNGGQFSVAATWATSMGAPSTAAVAERLVAELNPTTLAMCGVCAGRRDKVFLGDVIVAERVFSGDFGKSVVRVPEQGKRMQEFLHDIKTYTLDPVLKQEVEVFKDTWVRTDLAQKRPRSLSIQMRWLRQALYGFEKGEGIDPWMLADRQTLCPNWKTVVERLRNQGHLSLSGLTLTDEGRQVAANERLLDPVEGPGEDPEFRVHLGVMATGNDVKEDPEVFSRLEKVGRKIMAIDMEATAIYQVAEENRKSVGRAIVVKAVQDYADGDKDDLFRKFACTASAEFLLDFLCYTRVKVDLGADFTANGRAKTISIGLRNTATTAETHPKSGIPISSEMLDVLAEMGIVGSASGLAGSRFEPQECIKYVRKRLSFMGIGGSKWVEPARVRDKFRGFLSRVDYAGGEVRFLLMHPAGQAIKWLKQLGGGAVTVQGVQYLQALSKEFPSFHVRLHDHIPSFRMIFIDEKTLALSRYRIDKNGNFLSRFGLEAPHLVVTADAPWTLYDAFDVYYKQVWETAIRLEDI